MFQLGGHRRPVNAMGGFMTPRTKTDTIVIHCSATRAGQDIGVEQITAWHQAKGWETIGYHFVIRRDGTVEAGRLVQMIGAHVQGHNASSIGICLVGGIGADGDAENNFTPDQFAQCKALLEQLLATYPGCRIVGHRDLSPDTDGDGVIEPREWIKACPSFDVAAWVQSVGL